MTVSLASSLPLSLWAGLGEMWSSSSVGSEGGGELLCMECLSAVFFQLRSEDLIAEFAQVTNW